jgi:hypothetical protein
MDDTTPAFREFHRREMMKLSPDERLRIGSEMHDSARRIVLASLPGGMSEEERMYALFLRFYSRDFDEAAKSAIRRALAAASHGR